MLTDILRELRIRWYRMQMQTLDEDRAYWWGRMCEEIRQRSPEQVARMERERGLA
jgi:hypothetical protein